MYCAAAVVASFLSRASASKNQGWGGRIVCCKGYSAKYLNFDVEARAAMLQGVNELAEAVKVTMGPKVALNRYQECKAAAGFLLVT